MSNDLRCDKVSGMALMLLNDKSSDLYVAGIRQLRKHDHCQAHTLQTWELI